MSGYPLGPAFDRMTGLPQIGSFGADDVVFGMDQFGRVVPMARRGVQATRRFVQQRPMMQNRCGGDELGYFGADDEFGAIDAIDAEDREIDMLGDAGDDESIGALDDRIEKLQAKLYKRQQQLAVETRPRVQRRLSRQIERISDKLGKLQAKANRKAARKGEPIPYAAAAAGAAGLAAGGAAGYALANRGQPNVTLYDGQGRPVDVGQDWMSMANVTNRDVLGVFPGSQAAKRENKIPLLIGGNIKGGTSWTVTSATILAGDQVPFTAVSASLPFAEVEVVGLEAEIWVNGSQGSSGNLLPNCQVQLTVQSFNARGNANMFLDDQIITAGGSSGSSSLKGRLDGLRNNDIVRATNTIQASGYLENVFDLIYVSSPARADFLQVKFSLSAIVNITADDNNGPRTRR